MEQNGLLDIPKIHRSLTASWRRWEEAPNQDHRKALGEDLSATKAQLAAWLTPPEGEPRYADQAVRTLKDQIACVEAVLVQHDQKQARGY